MKRILSKHRHTSENLDGNKDGAGRRWTHRFGCTKSQLRRAKNKVGTASGAVRAELSRTVPLRPE